MNTKVLAAILGAALVAVGCVQTVSGRKTAGVPFVNDKILARYDRSVDDVFQAAREVIRSNGVLVNTSDLYLTNTVDVVAKIVEGKINQCTVWVRVEKSEPKVSDVTIQTRTQGGVADLQLASDIKTQIALKLVR